MLLLKAAALASLFLPVPAAAPAPEPGQPVYPAGAAQQPVDPDLRPLLGTWHSVSASPPDVITPGASLTFTPDFMAGNGYSERIREVRKQGSIVAIQTGIRAVHNFESVAPDKMCRVVIGRVDPNPVPVSDADGNERKIRVGCYRRARPDGA